MKSDAKNKLVSFVGEHHYKTREIETALVKQGYSKEVIRSSIVHLLLSEVLHMEPQGSIVLKRANGKSKSAKPLKTARAK